jgi:hypothetical protein
MFNQTELLESGSWKGSINCENSQYKFVLSRDSDTKPWAIANVEKVAEESLGVWNDRKSLLADLVLAPRTRILPQVFQSPSFKCVNVAPEPTNGEGLVRVTFTFTPEGVNRLRGGWVVLDPSHYWVIREDEIDLDLDRGDQKNGVAKWKAHYEYKEGSDHHPIMTRSVMKGKVWENGRVISEQEYLADDDLHERPPIPESEFTLSAFGFPEPFDLAPSKPRWYTRWWFLAAVAGVVCLGGAVLFRRFAARPAAPG